MTALAWAESKSSEPQGPDGFRKPDWPSIKITSGQTGWMQGGKYGFILDSTVNDFVSGELEKAIVECDREMAFSSSPLTKSLTNVMPME